LSDNQGSIRQIQSQIDNDESEQPAQDQGHAPMNPNRIRQGWLTALLLAITTTAAAEECRPPSIGLALGSGGAGGLAHIAMLEVFEDLDIRPDGLAGTSIGAVVATLYAAGLDAGEIAEIFREFGGSALDPLSGLLGNNGGPGWRDLVDIDLENGGFIDADGFLDFIGERFEARSFAELDLPIKIVATNYWDGEAHVFVDGDLMTAIKASMAVPGLFIPVRLGDKLLVDGGASNPLPVDLLTDHDVIIAIDVTGTREPDGEGSPGITNLLFKTFEIMQQSIIRARIAQTSADIYIKPALSGIRLLHFDRVDEVLDAAETAANELRDQLNALNLCRQAASD
jgi:NTE family protein